MTNTGAFRRTLRATLGVVSATIAPIPTEWRKTTFGLAKSSTRRAERARQWGERWREWDEWDIDAVAAKQGGAIDLAQLADIGLAPSAVRDRVRAGRLHRRYPGVYAVGRPDLPREGHWWAAVLACGPGALLSHFSNSASLGLLSSSATVVDVTVPLTRHPVHPGIRVHRATLASADRVLDDGVPRTSTARTLLDLAAVAPEGVVSSAVGRMAVANELDMSSIDELLARSKGHRGVRKLRAALGAHRAGDGQPRSELERRFLDLCRRYELPMPLTNQWMAVAGEEMEVDFVWHRERLVVETDGFEAHGGRGAFVSDRRRDQLLGANGWRVIRVTWDDVVAAPTRIASLIRKALRQPLPV